MTNAAYILDEKRLRKNLELLAYIQQAVGIDIILALKGFAMWPVFSIIKECLHTCAASSLNEALLCYEVFGTKPHVYAPAYSPDEFARLLDISSHLTFNSLSQYTQYQKYVYSHAEQTSFGIRVNPGWSDVKTELYNPTAPASRLGVEAAQLSQLPVGIEGLHFHALCESGAESFEKVVDVFETRFGHLIAQAKWVNMGGGHLITGKEYNVELLISTLKKFQEKHAIHVILEPGAAIAWQTGELFTTVLDIVENGGVKTAMLNVSFTAHMPDTLEMPYRPVVQDASATPVENYYAYRLGGSSCLAGDFLETYYFPTPLHIGDAVVFEDMMHYTMVKTTLFNGVPHPDIAIRRIDGSVDVLRKFEYMDFKRRLG